MTGDSFREDKESWQVVELIDLSTIKKIGYLPEEMCQINPFWLNTFAADVIYTLIVSA